MTNMVFTAVSPVLPVRNLGASVRFYTEQLGFTFEFGDRVGSPLPDGSGAPAGTLESAAATLSCICNGWTRRNSQRRPLGLPCFAFSLRIPMPYSRSIWQQEPMTLVPQIEVVVWNALRCCSG